MTLITIYWSECHMKKDAEVLRYMRERRKGTTQELAAARAVYWLLSISVPNSSAHESSIGSFSLPSEYEIGGIQGSCLSIFCLILERIY